MTTKGPSADANSADGTGNSVSIRGETGKPPYGQVQFIGTYVACALGAIASYGGYVMPATSLSYINADIGPSQNITWVSLAWTLTLAVGYTLVGRLSDLFGRRWFFIGSSTLATVGCIVGATAQNVNQLIGANVLIGLSAAAQLSFTYVLCELVPMKHRFAVFSAMFAISIPIAGFDGLGTITWFFFYQPPRFAAIQVGRSKWQEIRDLDFGGIILFVGGLLLFLIGLSWGGNLYPWNSAHVIVTLVVGFVLCVSFILYETYVPLRRPLVPMHMFKSRDFCVVNIMATVGGMLYYSMNVIFPTMVETLFTTDTVCRGLMSCAIGGGVVGGQIVGCLVAIPGGFIRAKLIITCAMMAAFIAGLAGTGNREGTAVALATLGGFSVGVLESILNGLVNLVIADQAEIGAAVGVYGSVRSAGGVLATTIYVTILNNKVSDYRISILVPEAMKAGLPSSSIEALLTAISSGNSTALPQIPGMTNYIIAVVGVAMKEVYARAFKVVFLASISFGGPAFTASLWAPDAKGKLTGDILCHLESTKPLGGDEEKVTRESV